MAHSARTGEIQIDDYEIIEILINDSLFCNRWKIFCQVLKLEYSIKYDLDRLYNSNDPIANIVLKVLEFWKSNDPANANIPGLSARLRKIGCTKCADDIDDLCKYNEHGNSGISVGAPTTNLATTLKKLRIETPVEANPQSWQRKDDQKIWFNIREPTAFYLGRGKEMKIIEKQFKFCLDKKTMMAVAITGLGGIGKTEIARNYAKQFYEAVKGHCIWIDSETDQSMKQSLQDLARSKLNLSLNNEFGTEKRQEILLEEIYRKISRKGSLIIFDNLESYENSILHCLFDLASKEPPEILKPFVITTSRFRPAKKYFGDKCILLELNVLEKESAVEFFTKSFNAKVHLQQKGYLEAVGLLCGRLQCYPLAMQQAAAYINENLPNSPKASTLEKEIGKYLEKLEKEAKYLLDHKLPQFVALENSRTTFLTWRITFAKINEAPGYGSEAIHLMNSISFMSPDNIAKEFLINLFQRIEGNGSFNTDNKQEYMNRIDNSLELLRNHSMIKISEDKISIHRLVQEITRIGLEERDEFISSLDKMIQCMEKMMTDSEVTLDQLIHVQMVWEFAVKNPEIIKKYPDFSYWINNKLYLSGRYQDSLNFSCRAVKEMESILGMENRSTLRMSFWKGAILEDLGEYKDSLSLLLEVYGKQKELFGEEDDQCLHTARTIGMVYYRLDNYEEAIKWYKDALEKREKVSGKEHQETLSLKHDLAVAFADQGKDKEAMELYKEVLEVKERLLGKNHRDTLATKHNMACLLFEEKEYEKALKMFQEVLDMKEKVLELNHPDTLSTKYWIASIYNSLGRVEEALQLAEEVYEKRKEILGPQHPDTISSFNLLEGLKKQPLTDRKHRKSCILI